MKLLSAIVPCYNEEENVPYFMGDCLFKTANSIFHTICV